MLALCSLVFGAAAFVRRPASLLPRQGTPAVRSHSQLTRFGKAELVSEEEFDKALDTDLPVLVDFFADW